MDLIFDKAEVEAEATEAQITRDFSAIELAESEPASRWGLSSMQKSCAGAEILDRVIG